jgi:hypothetical protein
MNIETTKHLKEAIRHPYAWPGGYPTFLLMSDNDTMCMKCAKEEYKTLLRAVRDNDNRSGWRPVAQDINWESEDYCGHCGKPIEAAYPTNQEQDNA